MAKQRMSIEQYVEVTDWLKMNRNRIEALESTQLEAAAVAEAELGYVVPITTIQRCAKIVGVKWLRSPPPVPLDHEAIVILIGAIAGLYIETGRTIPTELANLKSTYVRNEDKNTKSEEECLQGLRKDWSEDKNTESDEPEPREPVIDYGK